MTTKIERNPQQIVTNKDKAGGEKKEKTKSEHFTLLQAGALILITLIISIGGWYVVGKKYFWNTLDMKRVNAQLNYYEQKVQQDPKNVDNLITLGYTYFLKGENDKAIAEFKQVLSLKKDYYDAYYNLGLVYLDEERYDDSLEMFEKCVQLGPRDFKGHLQKGVAYRGLEMYDSAIKSFDEANKLMPGNADIIYQIGLTAEEKGDKKAAIEIYKEALRYDPLYKEAINGLERVQKK